MARADWWAPLSVFALSTVAVVGGGAAVRLLRLLGTRPAVVTMALVVALLFAVVVGTARSRERLSTPYW